MWWTSHGERVLEGAEADLFAHVLATTLDDIVEAHQYAESEGDEWAALLPAFDDLTYGQKIQVLATVAEGLLLQEVPTVPLTAAVEAGIGAVYGYLKAYVDQEIGAEELPDQEEQDRYYWRRKILAVCTQWGLDEGDPSNPRSPEPTREDCADMNEWECLIEDIADLALFDRDYENGNLVMDLPPERSQEIHEVMRINPDYYQAIPEDLTEEQAAAAIARINQILRKVVPEAYQA